MSKTNELFALESEDGLLVLNCECREKEHHPIILPTLKSAIKVKTAILIEIKNHKGINIIRFLRSGEKIS